MDTIIRSEADSQTIQRWNKGKLTGATPPRPTFLGRERASIGELTCPTSALRERAAVDLHPSRYV